MTDPPLALELADLSVRAGERDLLRGASLTVRVGEVVLLAGPSGGGKSVLLKVIGGLITRGSPGFEVAGTLRVMGDDVVSAPGAARGRVGLVFQEFALFTGLTAGGNISFALDHRRPRPASADREGVLSRIAEELGIERAAPVRELSGGQRQRVAIGRALAFRPEVLAYDEPTSGLDPAVRDQVGDLIRRTNKEHGATTLIVTHDLTGLLRVADRVVLLDPIRRALVEVPAEEAPARLRELQVPAAPPRRRPPLPSRVANGAAAFFEASFRVLEGLALAVLHLVPLFPGRRWGFRFFWHYFKMVAGPGSLVYFLLAGAVIGLVSTYFTFTFLPYRQYTEGILLDDLIGGLGFGLHRILVPLFTTILLAARAGAAVSADISTRVAGREDDAMRTFGVAPSRYLLTGSLWAFLAGMPLVAVLAFLGSSAASAGVFTVMAPEHSLHTWSTMFHRLLTDPDCFLPLGSGWVAAKSLCAAFGIAAIAYFRGASPKHSPGDVARAITSTVIWSTVLVLAIHTVFSLVEF